MAPREAMRSQAQARYGVSSEELAILLCTRKDYFIWALLEPQECLHKKVRCTEGSEWPRDWHRVTPRARPLNRPQLTLQSTNSPGIASVNASFQVIASPILCHPHSALVVHAHHVSPHAQERSPPPPSSATHRL